MRAKSKGFSDVLYLDSVNKRYLEEASSCNLFIVKDGVISTPGTNGTILPGITRKSIMELAQNICYQVSERLVSIDDLREADEVFCTGTAVVVSPVSSIKAFSSITYQGHRYRYRIGEETVSKKLYTALTSIQMRLVEDKNGWTVKID
ncbi:branched-chain-amino-acid aminotransferase 2, chloroplastic-like [Carex rostrata]